MPLLEIRNLSVEYSSKTGRVQAVRQVSLGISAGETLGLVGESGCGKSTLALSILRLLPEKAAQVTSGQILFQGKDLLRIPREDLRAVRGGEIAMVFQDPFSALNPVLTVGGQMEEALEVHVGTRRKTMALDLFSQVRLPEPERIFNAYPHQISGGQRQRVMLAMAVAAKPKLLIADEPTTALDVTVQKDILNLLDELKKNLGLAILFVTHNMGLLSQRAQRLAVMYAGEIIELADTAQVIGQPMHPYTTGLLKSLPRLSHTAARLPMVPGQPPDLRHVPSGCPFHPRCPQVFEPCPTERPPLTLRQGRPVACHLYPPA